MYGAVLWILVFIFMIVTPQGQYYGLPDDHRTHDPVGWQKSPWQETLSVYLAVRRAVLRQRPVGISRRFTRKTEAGPRIVGCGLDSLLRKLKPRHAKHECDLCNGHRIQGLGAKLVWITPKVREELNDEDDRSNPQLD